MGKIRKLIGAAFVAAALAGGGAAPALAQRTTLNFGIAAADANSLDPHKTATTQDKVVLSWIFNGLVRIAPGQSNPKYIEPDLAESWDSSADGLEWTFHLRHGVMCHKGYGELTADDVVFSLHRAANPKTSSFASDFAQFKTVVAVDRYTVKITLSDHVPSLLGLVTNFQGGNIVCKAAVEALGDDFARDPVGTGPFVFESYAPQQAITLSANEAYFRGSPQIKKILYRYLPSDASRELALMSGEIDIMQGTGTSDYVDRINAKNGFHAFLGGPPELSVLHLNVTVPPLNDIRVRKALAMAINRDDIIALFGHTAWPATSVIPSNNLGYKDFSDILPKYDIKAAKALLTEAGFADGLKLSTIVSNKPTILPTMQVLQAQLAQIGVELEINVVDHATYHQQIRKDLSEVVYYGASRFPIADVYLTQFYHSRSAINKPTAVTNFSHCDVADVDIDAARVETDANKQLQLWAKAQRKVIENVCAIPLYEGLWDWGKANDLDLGFEYVGSLTGGPMLTEQTHFAK
ncbi:ABC transporter substrate-binding protein [Mesorhizobium sp. NZP2077]|uniref:ABC transporter substrate-binding protein n=1 Tax=Mesorhizobium sp. NZP2077 TaxID=2483404 RepID=UPI0015530B6B|nr:ABC transporter substrate-binding protein [Mesorhizobium sp. NZP2077]QKC86830.1 polyamine ABC transporter substrate-binding protein [Mesorhizobium sp. NZP2077]QKD20536.1 polyamine ABC transporter substrate-binding protein [Mesorhizobium sp. NZP2077]